MWKAFNRIMNKICFVSNNNNDNYCTCISKVFIKIMNKICLVSDPY
jgi:hypothetical protein